MYWNVYYVYFVDGLTQMRGDRSVRGTGVSLSLLELVLINMPAARRMLTHRLASLERR